MLNRILLILSGILLSSFLLGQGTPKKKLPIKYRLLMTSVSVEDVNPDEISISLNAFNTGRNPIEFAEFNSIPTEMEIKFEESFYRSSLSDLEGKITASLIQQRLSIPNGKILRNLRFNLPCSEDLYKQLTKREKKFTKNYSPKKKNNAPALKYKTTDKKSNRLPNFLVKNDKKNKKEVEQQVEVAKIEVSSPKKTNKVEAEVLEPVVNIPKSNKDYADTKTKVLKETEVKKQIPQVKTKSTTLKPTELSDPEIVTQTQKIKTTVTTPDIVEEVAIITDKRNNNPKKQNIGVVIEEKREKKLSLLKKKKQKKLELEEIRKNTYEIEKASEQEEQKEILAALGVSDKKMEIEEEKNSLFNKSDEADEPAFDTKAGVEASKNSYADKAVCPDLILEDIKIVKKNNKWVTLEYTLTNIGKGPAYLDIKGSQGIALRAFLSSSENISRGALPLGGGFVSHDDDVTGSELFPDSSFTGTLKLDIRKMTRFTPFVILNFDPFNVLGECDKTNNYGNIMIGG